MLMISQNGDKVINIDSVPKLMTVERKSFEKRKEFAIVACCSVIAQSGTALAVYPSPEEAGRITLRLLDAYEKSKAGYGSYIFRFPAAEK